MKTIDAAEGAALDVAAGAASPIIEELVDAVVDAAAELSLVGRRRGLLDGRADRLVVIGLGSGAGHSGPSNPGSRPSMAVWAGEPMPQPQQVHARRAIAARSRLFASGRRALRLVPDGRLRQTVGRMGGRAAEHEPWRNLDAALGLSRRCDALVVTSRDQLAVMAACGVSAGAVPYGYSPRQHGEMRAGGERDVAALALGGHVGPTCGRRRQWVERWREAGLGPTVVEGLWGQERTALLRRTRVVLQVHRFPGSFLGIRLVMALAAGAVVVSEPMTDPYPFVPGIHFVQAPAESMAAETRALLADEPRRRRIVEAGQALLREELTMAHSLAGVLELLDSAAQGSKERTASIT